MDTTPHDDNSRSVEVHPITAGEIAAIRRGEQIPAGVYIVTEQIHL